MNTSRTNKLYNFLVNTYGLSKEIVQEQFNKRVDDVVDKMLSKQIAAKLDSSAFEKAILNQVTRYLQSGNSDACYNRETFTEFVKGCIRAEVADQIKKNYKITLKPTVASSK